MGNKDYVIVIWHSYGEPIYNLVKASEVEAVRQRVGVNWGEKVQEGVKELCEPVKTIENGMTTYIYSSYDNMTSLFSYVNENNLNVVEELNFQTG